MERLLVFADFDWLADAPFVGELCHETLRGSDTYSFRFAESWLARHGDLFFGEDLNSYPGMQFTKPGRDIFGCFSDALPDRWGRTLLKRRELLQAKEESRAPRRLSSFDYLLGIDDFSRMGGLRFKEKADGGFINASAALRIPPLADIRGLIFASQEIERSEEENLLPEKRWLYQLLRPGTSLGGARPKASVTDEHGNLCVAKFPSRADDRDIGLWEHFAHLLAKEAGIEAAATKPLRAGGKYHTLLSRRFDRTSEGRRVHFASALTLLGLDDGDNAQTGRGYVDIADFILQHCTRVEQNLEELYRRAAFNVCIGNSDDHFRNHGFLLTPKGWTLSPAYDLNPTLSRHQSLLISSSTNEADLSSLFQAREEYLLPEKTARRILEEVTAAVSRWQSLANRLGLPPREQDLFASRFIVAFKPL